MSNKNKPIYLSEDMRNQGFDLKQIVKALESVFGTDRIKRIGYEISSDEAVSNAGKVNIANIGRIIPDVVRGLTVKDPSQVPENPDDNKWAYFFGPDHSYERIDSKNGFDYSTYLKKHYPNNYDKIKSYKGIIHPLDTMYIDNSAKHIVDSLANTKSHAYLNADEDYLDYVEYGADDTINEGRPVSSNLINLGYRDDVHNYIAKFKKDKRGKIVVDASDLYDFEPNHYSSQFKGLSQAELMNAYGTPYILRQNNIPVKFINLDEKSKLPAMKKNGSETRANMTSREKIAANIATQLLSNQFKNK